MEKFLIENAKLLANGWHYWDGVRVGVFISFIIYFCVAESIKRDNPGEDGVVLRGLLIFCMGLLSFAWPLLAIILLCLWVIFIQIGWVVVLAFLVKFLWGTRHNKWWKKPLIWRKDD